MKNFNFRISSKKGLMIVNKLEELQIVDNLYLYDQRGNRTFEDSIRDFGRENVLRFSEIPLPDTDKRGFIKYQELVNRRYNIGRDDPIKYIISKVDFSKFTENELKDFILSINFRCYSDGQLRDNIEVREIYLIDCNILELKDNVLAHSPILKTSRSVFYVNCKIGKIYVESGGNRLNTFKNCVIQHLCQLHHTDEFVLKNNTVLDLVTESKKIILENVKLRLYHHKNLDNVEMITDNVEIKFQNDSLKMVDKKFYKGYWNTFSHLLSNIGSLNSERLDIEKYVHYFSAQDNWFKKLLFWFHAGYTNWKIPSLLTLILLLMNFLILYYGLNYSEDALVYAIFPIDLFKDVILKDFSFSNSFNFYKFSLFVSEIFLIFSFFSSSLAIKKIFGFKIVK